MSSLDLRAYVRDIPDFPRPGVVFKDITPLLLDPVALDAAVSALAVYAEPLGIDLHYAVLATDLGCPTSRSFFARCGIPRTSTVRLEGCVRCLRERICALATAGGNRTGAPCSPERTWAEKDGRSPTIASCHS